jgi:hypothetical protein
LRNWHAAHWLIWSPMPRPMRPSQELPAVGASRLKTFLPRRVVPESRPPR